MRKIVQTWYSNHEHPLLVLMGLVRQLALQGGSTESYGDTACTRGSLPGGGVCTVAAGPSSSANPGGCVINIEVLLSSDEDGSAQRASEALDDIRQAGGFRRAGSS